MQVKSGTRRRLARALAIASTALPLTLISCTRKVCVDVRRTGTQAPVEGAQVIIGSVGYFRDFGIPFEPTLTDSHGSCCVLVPWGECFVYVRIEHELSAHFRLEPQRIAPSQNEAIWFAASSEAPLHLKESVLIRVYRRPPAP